MKHYLDAIVDRILLLPRNVLTGIAAALVAIVLLYYPLGMFWVHSINDDPAFEAGRFKVENGSNAVAIAVALIDREVNRTHWTPNDPFFMPGAMLERMPAFQKGMISALSRFALQLSDQLARTRGSSAADEDLLKAIGLLNYPPERWIFDFSSSLIPTASAETQYRTALKALDSYNQRLARGEAVYDRRADNLLDTLERIASDLGSASASIATHIDQGGEAWIDTDADIVFYNAKGRMYAYYLLLRELEKDYADIIANRQLTSTWTGMQESLRQGATIGHFFVLNADVDSQFLPNHLATQGFYLMRARTQLREITNILLK